jgi:hypothetical protein
MKDVVILKPQDVVILLKLVEIVKALYGPGRVVRSEGRLLRPFINQSQKPREKTTNFSLLTLVDAIRGGRASDKSMTIEEIRKRFYRHAEAQNAVGMFG